MGIRGRVHLSVERTGASPGHGQEASGLRNSAASTALKLKPATKVVALTAPQHGTNDDATKTPIKHVLVIIGENRTFDHVFATYKPKDGQRVDNLLSKGIVKEDGTPGPNFALAIQKRAVDSPPSTYAAQPRLEQTPYTVLPPVLAGGPTTPYVTSLAEATTAESARSRPTTSQLLTTGAHGPDERHARHAPRAEPATRAARARSSSRPGIPYDDYSASPVHRFYQMWQQLDCSLGARDAREPVRLPRRPLPLGRDHHRRGHQRRAAAARASPTRRPARARPSMGFYNVLQGDAPYFKSLADTYAMSDNFHQAIQGGTGAEPHRARHRRRRLVQRRQRQRDRAAGARDREPRSAGRHEQLVHAGRLLRRHLQRLLRSRRSRASTEVTATCTSSAREAELRAGALLPPQQLQPRATSATARVDTVDQFTIPPSSTPTIGDELLAHDISWRYYGEEWNALRRRPDGLPSRATSTATSATRSSTPRRS